MRPFVLATLALAAACGGHPSTSDCEKIADHMLTIFTAPRAAEDGKVPHDVEQSTAVWRKNLLESERDPTRGLLIEVCKSEMGSRATSCILDAQDEVALAHCFGG